MPQNAPPNAPTPVKLRSCSVLGLLAPARQETMAPSTTVINCCFWRLSNLPSIIWAPSAVVNLSTPKGGTVIFLATQLPKNKKTRKTNRDTPFVDLNFGTPREPQL